MMNLDNGTRSIIGGKMVSVSFGKSLLFLTIVLILLVTSIVVVLFFLEISIKEPQKPEKVPDSAIWYGGSDGGVYIEIADKEIKPNTFYCTIYFDYTGDIWYEGLFEYNGDKTISAEKVKREITAYDGERIFLGTYGYLRKVNE